MAAALPWRVMLMARSLDLGGSERQAAEVAMSIDRRRFEPIVGCFDARGIRADDLRRARVPIVEFPIRSFAHSRTAAVGWRFIREVRRQRVALVHPFDVPTVVFGAPLARLARVPIVLSSQRGDRRLFPRGYQRALTLTDRLVDGIVVNSDYMRTVLATHFSVAADRIYTCRNGIDTTVFHPRGRTRRPELSPSGSVVGIVAALRPEKSIETLIDAFARVHGGLHQLAIIGDGPCRDALQRRARERRLEERCLFVPPALDVASWYRSIDVFVLPSTNESFSNSLMEAMACGCAVIASRAGGNAELVTDGANGLLFEPADVGDLARQLSVTLADAQLKIRIAAAAVQTIQRDYTREIAAGGFADLYERFLAPSASSSRVLRG